METKPIQLMGRAYGRSAPHPDEDLVRCGPGTLGGELLRRYWQPVALSTDAGSLPKSIHVLGEELILFRDGKGRPGLLYPRCAHRGTSLLYGRVEEDGIRCCYHGWKFDAQGVILDMPCEKMTPTTSAVRQPWYPLHEHHGLIFAYMGPPESQPAFPTFSITEGLEEDEEVLAIQTTCGPNGPHPKISARADYNWWQTFDNFMDPFHAVVTHYLINGTQFVPSLGILPEVKFEYMPDGVRTVQHRTLPDGRLHQRVSQVILPNMHCTPGVTDDDLGKANLGWIVPSTDESFLHFHLFRKKKGVNPFATFYNVGMLTDEWGPKHGRPFLEWSLEDHQLWQTDYVAQKGQGDINLHSEEHLTGIDAGIAMMRRLFKKQAAQVAAGSNPIGSIPSESYFVNIVAGNAILDPATNECIAGHDGRK
ncbi:Rieske 2Fe-2S domain-containing protein [Hydrogenophaga sp. YM1]|uniref:Rieske 2Fe-2S domain-containing protein n=1 Tax=Hydrogenophaga sp. YM1 TaxID=2806262 RepID=UPI00195C43D0|nr:Rieske 2Fe-2S domain-containing protein [Hydrogenophaga sp. YM1]QRR35606.1 Rieske 2Fe-2S domain-containing protein [Hydrogenophaga sp. YM1]